MSIFQAWGMTETSPVATFSRPQEGEHDEDYWDARAKQGRPLPWVELRLIGRRRRGGRVGRRVDGRDRGPRAVDRGALLQRRLGRREVRRRLAAHGRHRGGRRGRLRADHRPRQGRDQVGRRVDLLGRARERDDVAPGRRRGGGDREARRALGGAAAVLRRAARRARARRRRSSSSTCAGASRSGGCPTSSPSSRRSRRRASASSTRRCCAASLSEDALEGRVRVS